MSLMSIFENGILTDAIRNHNLELTALRAELGIRDAFDAAVHQRLLDQLFEDASYYIIKKKAEHLFLTKEKDQTHGHTMIEKTADHDNAKDLYTHQKLTDLVVARIAGQDEAEKHRQWEDEYDATFPLADDE